MNTFSPSILAGVHVDDLIRAASHQRLVRELQRREQPTAAATTVQKPRRHSRRWSLVRIRHAHS